MAVYDMASWRPCSIMTLGPVVLQGVGCMTSVVYNVPNFNDLIFNYIVQQIYHASIYLYAQYVIGILTKSIASDLTKTVKWQDDKVVMIDQTKLPNELVYVTYDNYTDVAHAIKTLVVRGAPAIGVSGAFGLALAAKQSKTNNKDKLVKELEQAAQTLAATRPTAVNLKWGLQQILDSVKDTITDNPNATINDIINKTVDTAIKMASDDVAINMAMGQNGAKLFSDNDTIMTHCNAGALATVAYGTALGVVRAVRDSGKNIKVIATETRPVQQGSRLTAFELQHDGIDVSLIPDTAVGYSMAKNLVNRVVVGADRILKTGHVYNKIGTYQVATMARQHNIPFYVAAPLSTFDMKSSPDDVVIEQRNPDEVIRTGDRKTAPDGIKVINPAFDVTPPHLISAIITEKGVATPPFEESIQKLFQANF